MFGRTTAPEADVPLPEVGFTFLYWLATEGTAFSECVGFVVQRA